MSLTLTHKEIETVTGRKKFSAQVRQLQRMGIECKRAADGSPVVSRLAFEQAMGVKHEAANDVKLHLDFLNAS